MGFYLEIDASWLNIDHWRPGMQTQFIQLPLAFHKKCQQESIPGSIHTAHLQTAPALLATRCITGESSGEQI